MATRPLELLESETEEPTAFDEQDLVAILKREFEAADSEYEHMRKIIINAHNYYEAKPFGNEVDGRSQIVLPDVQETVDYMSVSVLRTFVSGDKVVEFEATDEADEEYTDEATAAIGYNFMRQQDGYRILHDWCVSGLLERAGIAKTMVETQEKVSRENVVISDPVELEGFDGEIEDSQENSDGTWTISTKRTVRQKRFTDVSVPFGEFRFSPNARHEDDADYLAHCPIKTRSELVDMGFDRDQVYGLPAYTKLPDETREDWWDHAESSPALQEVLLCEEYARIDIDGDGIAERVKVCRVENEILRYAVPYANGGELAIETVEDQPFTVFCPFPRPHRLVGWSLADKVMDIQLGRSTIARQLFDGMYNANMPRPVVDESQLGENTIDDLLSPIAGSPIRVRGGATSVQPYQTGFDVGKSMTVLEWMTGERESRTGITRLNQGLDADALNKTATGTALMQAQGQQQEEFIARNLAEALSRLMAKKYRLMRVEGEPFRVRVDGKYKMVDPRKWPEEVNVTIRVGLGTGSKDKRIQGRMALAPLLAEGFANKQVTPKHLFNAVDGLVRDLGLGQGDDFWKDPDAPPAIDPATGQPVEEPDEPDPEMLAMQAEQQREEAKLELERQKAAANVETTRAVSEAKIQLMRDEGAAKLELDREKAEFEAQMAREQQAFEMAMAERQFAAEQMQAERRMELEARNAEHRATIAERDAESRISKNRPGGQLDK